MSDSETMTWEGKKFNPREEEKFLDDKLMDIGLLEPGMTLQEKRDLASVVMESTRMAEEQMSQRVEEENWEVMVLSEEDEKGDVADISKKKGCVGKPGGSLAESAEKISASSEDGPQKTGLLRGLLHIINDDKLEKRERERKEKDASKQKEEKLLEITVGEEKKDRETAIRTEKDRENKGEEETRKERQMKRKEEERERLQRVRRKEENRMRKEEGSRKDKGKEKSEKAIEKPVDEAEELDRSDMEHKKEKSAISRTSFYGPSSLRDAKHPNPFSTEIYGSVNKNSARKSNIGLLKLVEVDMRNQQAKLADDASEKNEESSKMPERRVGAKELASSSKEKESLSESPRYRRSYNRGRREMDVKDVDEDKEDDFEIFPKQETVLPKDVKKRVGERARKLVTIALSSQSGSVGKIQECEKRRREERSDEVEIEDFKKGEGEDVSNGDLKTPDEKKRRLERGQLMKRWSDVVAADSSQIPQPEEVVDVEDSAENKFKEVLRPNKRWRRVKRKFRSSYGSGSEVDEWISSEEEKKNEVKPLTKDQLVTKFDNYLLLLKKALQKQHPCEAEERKVKVKDHICKNRSKYKVPPGFQEPDSDDECNLWKICFIDKPAPKGKSGKEEIKADSAVSVSKMVATRSSIRLRNCSSPCLSSKSPSSVEEEREISSPPRLSPLKEILPGPSNHSTDEIRSGSKSPSLEETALFNKVICPTSVISRSTQTIENSDAESDNSSSSSSASTPPLSKANEVTQESKPMWDLLEVNDELKDDKKEESVELEEVDLTTQEESQPDPVTCPICSRAFPMSEIEAHASVCNAEEEDESSDGDAFIEPRVRRDQHLRSQRMTVSKAAGASHQNKMDMDEVEEEVDDHSYEEEDDYQPRPPQLATFIPISQQKDSLIDYNNQFPHRSGGTNLQVSLDRMRKKLMRGGKTKTGWRKRKKGKWKRVAKK